MRAIAIADLPGRSRASVACNAGGTAAVVAEPARSACAGEELSQAGLGCYRTDRSDEPIAPARYRHNKVVFVVRTLAQYAAQRGDVLQLRVFVSTTAFGHTAAMQV